MKKSNDTNSHLGDSVSSTCYFLSLLFCVLQACDIIDWKWYWIMSPMFITWAITLVCTAIVLIAGYAVSHSNKRSKK